MARGPGSYGVPAFALRPLRVARGRRRCDHDYPRWGGHNTHMCVVQTYSCSAHRLLSWVGAPRQQGCGPSLCATPMPQGLSYVQVSGLGPYIRKQLPIRAPAGLSRVQSKPLPGRARTLHPPARPDLFSPNVGEEEFSEVRSQLAEKFRKTIEISEKRRPRPQNSLRIHRPMVCVALHAHPCAAIKATLSRGGDAKPRGLLPS